MQTAPGRYLYSEGLSVINLLVDWNFRFEFRTYVKTSSFMPGFTLYTFRYLSKVPKVPPPLPLLFCRKEEAPSELVQYTPDTLNASFIMATG